MRMPPLTPPSPVVARVTDHEAAGAARFEAVIPGTSRASREATCAVAPHHYPRGEAASRAKFNHY